MRSLGGEEVQARADIGCEGFDCAVSALRARGVWRILGGRCVWPKERGGGCGLGMLVAYNTRRIGFTAGRRKWLWAQR